MSEWIFKIIWIPAFIIVVMCCVPILVLLLKESGWDVPFRWIVIIGGIAAIADHCVNGTS